jgi:hypothetical protein
LGLAVGAWGFAVLAEDVLDGVLGAVVLFGEVGAAVFVAFVLADDVEFGVDGEFALGAEFLFRGGGLALMVDGAGCTFRFWCGHSGAPGRGAGFGSVLCVMVLRNR